VLEEAISAITGENVRTDASGRTDAGAHALGQVVAFSTASTLPAPTLRRAINVHLPFDIAVSEVAEAEPGFNPRRDARSRTYRYLIWNRVVRSPLWHGRAAHIRQPLNERAMHEAAQALVGNHDFSSFVPVRQAGNRIRRVDRAACSREGDVITFEIEGSGFMRQMVRSMAGTLISVGLGKMTVRDVADVVASRTRTEAGDTAPAHALYLVDVRYASDSDISMDTPGGVQARRVEETV
jgi:tRNA pseudouridine38-40 synthase